MREQEKLISSIEILLAGLRGLAGAIASDLENNNSAPGMIPAIPLHGRPLMGFMAIFVAARNVEVALEQAKGGMAESESPLSDMQTQGSA